MQDKINKILDLILTSMQTVGTVVSKEVPILTHQLVVYYIIESIPFISLAIFIGTLLFWISFKKHACDPHNKEWNSEGRNWMVCVLLLVQFTSGALFLDGLKSLAQGYYAPQAFLIMHLKNDNQK